MSEEEPKKSGRGMNDFMKTMTEAKRAGKESFQYKGNTYKKSKSKTGLVVYKKG